MTSSKTAIKIHSVESQTRLFFLINPTSRELRELKKKKKISGPSGPEVPGISI